MSKYTPFYYQSFAESYLLENPEAGLFFDMGMGKTAITLSAVEKLLYDSFEVKKVLVVAPLKPAEETWPAEIKKWDHLKHLKYVLVMGPEKQRLAAIHSKADIYIINRENIPWLVQTTKGAWPFDMVVLDELSSFKSNQAKRFKALKAVRKKIKRIVGLTGTPAPNNLLDLWPQVFLLDSGKALGQTLTGYREQYFSPDKRSATTIFSWKIKDGAEEQIYKKLEGLCISMRAADYLQLPERLDVQHKITLSAEAQQQYAQLQKDMLLPFVDGDIDAATAAILVNKLLQFSSGAVYDENGNAKVFHDAKFVELDRLIEEANGQPVLVFYAYKHELERLRKKYPQGVEVREENAVTRWNTGKIPILFAHPASAGHGLNLQDGGHIVIWLTLPWSLELYLQANARLHRLGQLFPVLVHHIIVEGSIDEQVFDSLLQKEVGQEGLLNAVRVYIKGVFHAT